MKRISFFCLLLLIIPAALMAQTVKVSSVEGRALFRLSDGRLFKLRDLLVPSPEDTNSIVAAYGKKIRQWEEERFLNKEFKIAGNTETKGDTLYGDLLIEGSIKDKSVLGVYLENGSALYTGQQSVKGYRQMLGKQGQAQLNKLGIWKALYFNGKSFTPFRNMTPDEIEESDRLAEEAMEKAKEEDNESFRPGDQELLIMPSAYTMPEGHAYFSAYELIFLNFNYAVTSSTHIGLFTIFPMGKDFMETFCIGIKQKYLNFRTFKAAAWGTYNPESGLLIAGNVFSFGNKASSFHAGIGMIKNVGTGYNNGSDYLGLFKMAPDRKAELIYMAGYRGDRSSRSSVFIEYTNSSGASKDFSGLISLGLRLSGENLSWEISGIRPITEAKSLFFLPMLKATYLF